MNPPNASNKKVTWSSSDETVAKVEGTGLTAVVTAKKAGTATITVTTVEGNRTATCVVTVKAVESFTVVGDYEKYYEPNDEFNSAGIKIKVIYTDGTVSPDPIPVQEAWITKSPTWNILSTPSTAPYAASEVHPITVTYGGVKQDFDVTIRAVRWVTIIGTPKRTVYNVGEPFDPEGLTLTAAYDVGLPKTGIPLTREILATASNYSTWNGHSSASTGVPGTNVTLGPFTYKGQPTTGYDGSVYTPGGPNLGTLNGEAVIRNLNVYYVVLKIGDKYAGFPGNSSNIKLEDVFTQAAGQKATITVSTTTSNATPLAALPAAGINVSESSDITLVSYSPYSLAQAAAAESMFAVGKNASLRVDNFTLTSHATNTAPIVQVSGENSRFTLGGGSKMARGAGAMGTTTHAGILEVLSGGTATIEEGVEVTTNDSTPRTIGNISYMATTGIYVGNGGKLIMNGGIVQGTPAIPSPAGTIVGVGDVVVAPGGALELDGSAWIGRLALAANSKIEKEMVTLKDNWNPSRSLVLNLTGNNASVTTVQGYFVDNTLFAGASAAKMGKFVFEKTAGNTNPNSGGWFISSAFVEATPTAGGTGSTGNPVLITAHELSSDGKLVVKR